MILDILLWPFMMFYRLIHKIFTSLNKPVGASEEQKNNKNKQIAVMQLTAADAIKNTKKVKYNYTARDKNGKITKSSLSAFSKLEVHSFLESQGLDVLDIKESKYGTKFSLLLTDRQMSTKDLTFFLTQLSTYIKSGIPLIDAVQILSNQAKKKSLKVLYNRIVFELNSGVSFSQALVNQGKIFPKLLINMVKTSELTGNLTGVLDDMASYYKGIEENRKQIISAMTYPSVIFIFAIVVLTFIILNIVPSFVSMYSELGSGLPAITKVIIHLSDFLQGNILYLILVIISLVFILVMMYKNITGFRYGVQWVAMHIPVVSKMIINSEVIMFTKTFASLINYDVFITDSMEILGKITNNEVYKMLIRDAVTNLSNGNGVSIAFKGQWAFPDIAYQMLLTGERTGRMGPMMQSVCEYYESEQKTLTTQLKSLIEPLMIVFLAVMVGIVLLAVMLPMFNMYNEVL